MNLIQANPPIPSPEGFCSPSNSTSTSFRAKYTVVVFLDVEWENKLSFSGDCVKPADIINSGNYTVPGGNFTFTFRFERFGMDAQGQPTFICTNRETFNSRWSAFMTRVNNKISANTLNETDTWPDGICYKWVDGVDQCGRPTRRTEARTLTRTKTRKKTPTVRYNQSIVSQNADCTLFS